MATAYADRTARRSRALVPANADAAAIATLLFLAIAFVLGGSGSRFPMTEMLVYLAAIPALFLSLIGKKKDRETMHLRGTKILILSTVALSVIQLVPLPPSVWQNLPGRAPLAEAAVLIGQGDAWRPWSINPDSTLRSALYLIVPVTAFIAVSRLDTGLQTRLLWCVMLAAALHLLIAIAQSLSGGESFYFYDTTHKGLPIGIFANRNHMALFLLISLVLAPAMLAARLHAAPLSRHMLYWALAFVLAIGILATSSRAVTVLLLLSILFLAYLSIPERHRKTGLIAIAICVSALVALVLLGWWTGNLGNLESLSARFEQSDDHRYEFWPDTLAAMGHYFPFGSGIGTFDEAFRSQESLDIIGTHYVNHAHNDYIEIIIETGIFGLILLAAMAVVMLPAMRRIIVGRTRGDITDLPLLACWGLTMIALHSLVDYPMRSLAIAALFGVLAAICISVPGGRHRLAVNRTGNEIRRPGIIAFGAKGNRLGV
ncbi:MAG: O-antigen ligase family protein [Pseudomonadota bacterium]